MTLEEWMRISHHQMQWLEAHRNPVLDALFVVLTTLGSEVFLILFVAVGYWLFDRERFVRAAFGLILAGLLNTWLKGVFMVARPEVSHVLATGGYSFPSGHAQVAGALWGGLAFELRARRRWALGLFILGVLIACSRPYLGVHYPHDVFVGFFLGLAQIPLVHFAERGLASLGREARLAVATSAIVGLLAWVELGFAEPQRPMGVRLAGALGGLWLGRSLPRAGLLATPRARRPRLRLLGLGVAGLVVLWAGLKLVFSGLGWGEAHAPAFLRYGLVGAWIAWGALWVGARVIDDARSV